MKKQLVSILFALCMVLCLVPLAVFAEGETENVQVVADQTTLVAAMADTSVTTVKLAADIDIDATLKVDRTVTLDLNGFVLKYQNDSQRGSVIVVENGGQLTIEDSNTSNLSHKFKPNDDGLWVLDEKDGTETVTGGVITGGTGYPIRFGAGEYVYYNYYGGGVYITDGQLTMKGGSIVGCSATDGGGVCMDPPTGKESRFSMSGGSIAGCVASDGGGGVYARAEGSVFDMSETALIRDCRCDSNGGGVRAYGTFQMSGQAVIRNCTAESTTQSIYGGGVYVNSSSSFVMSGEAKIEDCQAISNSSNSSNSSNGGGVYLTNNTTLTLSGSAAIKNCTAVNYADSGEAYGGGVSAARMRQITLEGDAQISQCAAANGSGLYITGVRNNSDYGKLYANGGSVDGDVVLGDKDKNDGPCTITGSGGTVFYGKVTVTPGSTIESGTFNGEVINNGTITGGTFSGGITGNPALATGSGTETDPYQIGTAEGLKRFRDIVNGENGRTQKLDACATLTADIVLNDGTFAEDGSYTPGPSSAALTEWSPMGNQYRIAAYSGTFDGAGHTIQGVYCNSYRGASGLFGYIDGATIRGVRVTGYFNADSAEYAGCIVAFAQNSRITGCVSTASINGDHSSQSATGGIVGIAESNTQVSDCINYGTVKCIISESNATNAGGIVGWLADSSNITNCSNFGTVIGLTYGSYTPSIYVGGIVGFAWTKSISDCYNAGAVRINEQGNSSATQVAGGIAGFAGFNDTNPVQISNCYNVGSVTAANANAMLGGIVGWSDYDSVAITNCYYLTGTAGQVYGHGTATVTATTEKSAFDFANGGVLALLMANRPADAQPWDTTCKYLESAGMTLPVLARQNLTVHAHVWSAYTTDTAAKTHTHSCACGVVETEACTITPATCKDGSACAVCGQQYGGPDTGKHADLQHFPAVAATTDAEGNTEYWYCGGCGKYFADAAATREITRADTVTAKLPQPTTPPTATPTAAPTTAPQAAEQPRRTAQPTVQPTAAPHRAAGIHHPRHRRYQQPHFVGRPAALQRRGFGSNGI